MGLDVLLPLTALFAVAAGLGLTLLLGAVWLLSRLAAHRTSGRHRLPNRWRI